MKLPHANEGGAFTPPPPGTHVAICYRIIDLGTQKTEFQGQVKHQHKIMVSWELADEMMEDGQPFTIHQRYTFSMYDRALLRQHLESWRGKPFEEADFGPEGFDLKKLLTVPCMLAVIHKTTDGKTYANISGVSGLPKSVPKPQAPKNPVMIFDLKEFDQGQFNALPEKIQDTIRSSPEYKAIAQGKPEEHVPDENSYGATADLDDEIPF